MLPSRPQERVVQNITDLPQRRPTASRRSSPSTTTEVLESLLDIAPRNHWAQDALCAQTDPEIFFPEKGGSIREATAVCAQCPVKQQCLDAALEEESGSSGYGRHGVRAGTTPRQRAHLAKERPEKSEEQMPRPLAA